MDVGKIVRIVAVLAAVVLSFVATPAGPMIIAVLGLVGGYFISQDETQGFLIAAIALGVCNQALLTIPVIGGPLSAILASLSALYLAAACKVIVVRLVHRLKP